MVRSILHYQALMHLLIQARDWGTSPDYHGLHSGDVLLWMRVKRCLLGYSSVDKSKEQIRDTRTTSLAKSKWPGLSETGPGLYFEISIMIIVMTCIMSIKSEECQRRPREGTENSRLGWCGWLACACSRFGNI